MQKPAQVQSEMVKVVRFGSSVAVAPAQRPAQNQLSAKFASNRYC